MCGRSFNEARCAMAAQRESASSQSRNLVADDDPARSPHGMARSRWVETVVTSRTSSPIVVWVSGRLERRCFTVWIRTVGGRSLFGAASRLSNDAVAIAVVASSCVLTAKHQEQQPGLTKASALGPRDPASRRPGLIMKREQRFLFFLLSFRRTPHGKS